MLLSVAQAPPSVSWRPQVSATIVSSTLPFERHQLRAGGEIDVAPARGSCPAPSSDPRSRARCRTACRPPGCLRGRRCGSLPFAHLVNPRLAGGNDRVVDGRRGIERALGQRHAFTLTGNTVSVSVKPRSFSGREMRHGSSAAGGGDAAHRQLHRLRRVARDSDRADAGRCSGSPARSSRRAARRTSPACEWPGTNVMRAVVVHHDLAEEVHRRRQVARARPYLASSTRKLS